MKTLILLLLPFSLFAQLDKYGEHFKTNNPASYEVIKTHAVEKWGNDFEMVVFQINKQSKACYDFFQLMKEPNMDADLALNAILKWRYDGYSTINGDLLEQQRLLELHVDWVMVLYDYEKQLKAKNSF